MSEFVPQALSIINRIRKLIKNPVDDLNSMDIKLIWSDIRLLEHLHDFDIPTCNY